MYLALAPMEGVLDFWVRDLLTQCNQYDLCVTEFVRVVDQLLPERVFFRMSPELYNSGFTQAGTPVRIQLLGREPGWMAENAVRAIELGSQGVDINFGCPSKGVNRKNGGAAMLQEPESIYRVVKSVRDAVPQRHVVSAKIRLGWDTDTFSCDIADAVAAGGANELVVHGRTKQDGYRADAINWNAIQKIVQRLSIPVCANGEIWDHKDANQCIQHSSTNRLMVGRGALTTPNLSQVIRHNSQIMLWDEVVSILLAYLDQDVPGNAPLYFPRRIKQWLKYLKKSYPQAITLFEHIRALNDIMSIRKALDTAQATNQRQQAI